MPHRVFDFFCDAAVAFNLHYDVDDGGSGGALL